METNKLVKENNNIENNRVGVRYACYGLQLKLRLGQKDEVVAKVKDISLDGLCMEVDEDIGMDDSSLVSIRLFDNTGELDKDLDAYVVKGREFDGKYIYHLRFKYPQRPEGFLHFNMYFSIPEMCNISRKQRNLNQQTIAEKDIDALHRSILNLKSCQFQLVLAAIPILFGVLGTLITFVSDDTKNGINQIYMFLPPASVILAFVLLAVFIQKTESIRRSSAFVLILQRHLTMGSFPSCYRGWQDAFENYNHHVRHGFLKSSPFDVNSFEEKKIRHRVPADSFTWLALALFTLTPVMSMALMFLVLGKSMTNGSYTVVVVVVTSIFVVAAILLYKKLVSLKSGKRSFRYLVVLFSKILKYSPPFDPYNNDPVVLQRIP